MFVSGGCRDLTNRIPASRTALLAAAAAAALVDMLSSPRAGVRVLSVNSAGVALIDCEAPIMARRVEADGWVVRLPVVCGGQNARGAGAALPQETGGALLGIVDHFRKRMEITGVLPPAD